jgi:hypothetical protein
LHRHTVAKYVYKLIGANIVHQRNVGATKLCYLKEDFEKNFGNKRKIGTSKSYTSISWLAFYLFILFASIAVVATNSTINGNLSVALFHTPVNTTEISELPASNQTTLMAFDEENYTQNESVENIQQINNISRNFTVEILRPEKITRGEIIEIKAVVTNTGSVEIKSVLLTWELPRGFEIVSGNERENCGILETNASCTSVIIVQSSLSAELGVNEIKVKVSYE